jgi:hypothetical protein
MILIILVLFVSCQHLEERGEDVTITNNMVVGVEGLIATGLIIAENMVVTVTQTLTSAKFYINVTNDVLVTVP